MSPKKIAQPIPVSPEHNHGASAQIRGISHREGKGWYTGESGQNSTNLVLRQECSIELSSEVFSKILQTRQME